MALYGQGRKNIQSFYNGNRHLLYYVDCCVGSILYADANALALEVFQNFFHAFKGTPQFANVEEESHIAENHVFHANFSELFYSTYYFIWGTMYVCVFT